jgi:hydrophobic/amphiphilic exporter-1 (mainly G- bacteria), HAE1 family
MIARFARHPTAANLLMLIFFAAGILSLPSLRRETFPDFTPSEVEVRIPYRGATAEEVEEAVCQRVEDAIDGVKFVKELRSEAREGMAIVVAEMEGGADVSQFQTDI